MISKYLCSCCLCRRFPSLTQRFALPVAILIPTCRLLSRRLWDKFCLEKTGPNLAHASVPARSHSQSVSDSFLYKIMTPSGARKLVDLPAKSVQSFLTSSHSLQNSHVEALLQEWLGLQKSERSLRLRMGAVIPKRKKGEETKVEASDGGCPNLCKVLTKFAWGTGASRQGSGIVSFIPFLAAQA